MFSSIFGALGPRYTIQGIQAASEKCYRDYRLSHLLVPTYIPALEVLQQKGAYVFSSSKARQNAERDYFVKDVAQATTAAPSYFESKEILQDATGQNKDKVLNFWDGGLFANNPSQIALHKARKLFPDRELKDFVLLSIGTGQKKYEINHQKSKKMGYANGGKAIFSIGMSGQSSSVESTMKSLLKKQYIRLQVDLEEEGIEMDNVRSDYLRSLYQATERMLEAEMPKIIRLKDIWEGQNGKKLSRYDLESEAKLLIAHRYSIPLLNKSEIQEIYDRFCELRWSEWIQRKDIKKIIRDIKSVTDLRYVGINH